LSPIAQSLVTASGGVLAGLALSGALLYRQRRRLVRLRYEATHDSLTGLGNRRAVLSVLDRAARRGLPHGLVLLDLDKFKTVNDTFGHEAGDQLLIQVGLRLAGLPAPVVLAGRLSGDEFVLVVHGHPGEVAQAACAAYSVIASEPVTVADRRLGITASVGYASAQLDHAAPSALPLLHRADMAMYRAKTTGGGVCGPPAAPSGASNPGTRRSCRDHRSPPAAPALWPGAAKRRPPTPFQPCCEQE